MPVKMNPTSVIKARLGIDTNGKVQKFFTNTCAKHMNKYIPKDIGNLRDIKIIEDNKITYESIYAKYQYYGIHSDGTGLVKKYTTPGTGPYWDKRMVSAEMADVVKEVQDYIGGK